MGNVGLCLLFHSFPLSFFFFLLLIYIPFLLCQVIKGCCFLLLLAVPFALQLKMYLTYTACTRGRLDSGLLQMDCSCFAGDKRRWPIRLNPTEPMQRREEERVREISLIAITTGINRAEPKRMGGGVELL
ncbi:hypothetical protein V8C40DRAFT_245214 [Trichoderma camerunense]